METKRNYGIDLLRVVSMYLVVVLHILGIGGVVTGAGLLSGNFCAAWLLRIGALCAVNCYALISGYVGFRVKGRLPGLLTLWAQTALYSIAIGLTARYLHPDAVSDRTVLGFFLPVSTGQYWYFTAFFGLSFLMPILNFAAAHMPRRELELTLAGILFLFSLLPISPLTDAFYLHDGYSVLWLAVMYLLGAYLGKYPDWNRLAGWKWALVFLLCVLLAWAPRMAALRWKPTLWADCYGNLAIEYTSPSMVLAAVALVGIFSRLRLGMLEKPVHFASRLSFGVYLIHAHPMVFRFWLEGHFASLGSLPAGQMAVRVLAAALGIYLLCSVLDALRLGLFRLLGIRQAAGWISGIVSRLFRSDSA